MEGNWRSFSFLFFFFAKPLLEASSTETVCICEVVWIQFCAVKKKKKKNEVFSLGFEDCLQVFDGADKPSVLGGIKLSDEEEEKLQVGSKIALVIMLFPYGLPLGSSVIPAPSLFIHPSVFLAPFPLLGGGG